MSRTGLTSLCTERETGGFVLKALFLFLILPMYLPHSWVNLLKDK